MPKQKIIGILGGGKFGTSLAKRFIEKSRVKLYSRDLKTLRKKKGELEYFREMRELKGSDLIVIAVPSLAIRGVINKFNSFYSGQPIIGVSKGIEKGTGLLPSQIVKEVWPKAKYAHLSGASFAVDVAGNLPIVVSLGMESLAHKKYFQQIIGLKDFKVQITEDLIGVQLGGILKNVIAIAAGMSDGLGYGESFRAVLILEGWRKMMLFGEKLGAKKETFFGTAGLGDIIMTASSSQSRNYQLGVDLAKKSRKTIINKVIKEGTFEGASSACTAHDLAKKLKIKLPIIGGVCKVIYKNKSPKKVLIEVKNEIF